MSVFSPMVIAKQEFNGHTRREFRSGPESSFARIESRAECLCRPIEKRRLNGIGIAAAAGLLVEVLPQTLRIVDDFLAHLPH